MSDKGMPKEIKGYLKLRRELARGGHGDVALYQDTRLSRDVAVKRRRLNLNSDKAKKRFIREAKMYAQFDHTHIIKIFDLAFDGSDVYQVLEYGNKGTLGEEIKRRQGRGRNFSIEEIKQIGLALCDALQTIHAKQMVHRDIKPDNVILHLDSGKDLIVKLGDFGVAHTTLLGSAITGREDIVGTLPYMAPEAFRNIHNSPKSDVYALGILLYRLLTKQHYLPMAPEPEEIKKRIMNDAPIPVQERRPDTPDWLAELVHQMLDKKPHRRPDARQVWQTLQTEGGARALIRIEDPRGGGARTVTPRQFVRGMLATTAATAVVAVFVFNAFLVDRLWPPVEAVLDEVPVLVEGPIATVEAAFAPETAVVAGSNDYNGLGFRGSPSGEGELITRLVDGTVVEIVEERTEWTKVEVDGVQGWVFSTYLVAN